jgi:hypothetical protein
MSPTALGHRDDTASPGCPLDTERATYGRDVRRRSAHDVPRMVPRATGTCRRPGPRPRYNVLARSRGHATAVTAPCPGRPHSHRNGTFARGKEETVPGAIALPGRVMPGNGTPFPHPRGMIVSRAP